MVHIHYSRLMLKSPPFPWNLMITKMMTDNDDDDHDAYDDDTSGDAGDDEILLPQYGESQEVLFLTFVFLSCAS